MVDIMIVIYFLVWLVSSGFLLVDIAAGIKKYHKDQNEQSIKEILINKKAA